MPEDQRRILWLWAFSKPSWRTDPASHDSSPRLVSERCLTARRLSRINLTCFHLHYASSRSKHWSLLRELTSGQLDRMGGWGLLAHVSVGCRRESGPGR